MSRTCDFDDCMEPACDDLVPLNPNMVPPADSGRALYSGCESHARAMTDPLSSLKAKASGTKSDAIYVNRVSVGRFICPEFRACLDHWGIDWTEHRAWPQSHFVIKAMQDQWRRIHRWIAASNGVQP